MTPTARHTGPVLSLSPAALAALKLTLKGDDFRILDADGGYIGSIDVGATADAELAAFIAALVNAALTPAQENFYDAVRADPDMTPERKAKWLAQELDREGVSIGERLARE